MPYLGPCEVWYSTIVRANSSPCSIVAIVASSVKPHTFQDLGLPSTINLCNTMYSTMWLCFGFDCTSRNSLPTPCTSRTCSLLMRTMACCNEASMWSRPKGRALFETIRALGEPLILQCMMMSDGRAFICLRYFTVTGSMQILDIALWSPLHRSVERPCQQPRCNGHIHCQCGVEPTVHVQSEIAQLLARGHPVQLRLLLGGPVAAVQAAYGYQFHGSLRSCRQAGTYLNKAVNRCFKARHS